MRKNFPFYQQADSHDCGVTCLKMIAKYYGKYYTSDTLRKMSYINKNGASLFGICRASNELGFSSSGLKLSLKALKEIELPCILYWNNKHFVVLYKISPSNNFFYIADPASTKRKVSVQEFSLNWLCIDDNNEKKGVALILSPQMGFYEKQDELNMLNHLTLRKFIKYISTYKWKMSFMMICMFFYMVTGLVTPFLTQALIDKGIKNSNLTIVKLILISQFVLFATNLCVQFFHSRLSTIVNTHIEISILSDFWKKLMMLPMRFFDSKNTGDLMQRIADHSRLRAFITKDMTNMAFAMLNLILYSLVLAYYNITILLVFLLSQSFCVLWMSCFIKEKKKLDYRSFEIESKNQSYVIQLLQGMQEIKLNNDESHKREQWENLQSIYLVNKLKILNLEHLKFCGAKLLTYSAEIFISFFDCKASC